MPKNYSGKLAVGFGIVLVASTTLSLISAAIIGGNQAVVEGSRLLSVLATGLSIIFSLAAPLSFFIGVYTVIKHKEWSVCKPLAVLYILSFLLFILGEFLFPH